MVYITSDLFGPAPIRNQDDNSHTNHWSILDEMSGLGKRKRLGEDTANCNTQCPSRLRLPQRSQAHHTQSENNNDHPYSLYAASSEYTAQERRPVKQLKRLSPKIALVKSTSHLMDTSPDMTPSYTLSVQQPTPVSDLRPCHACKSAPKRKKDLENYMDCRRCDGRTCYICARQCLGPCGKKICKKCIVEVGQEGDPWCLDCYSRQINS